MGVELYSCTISFDPGGTCIFSPLSCSSVCILVFWHLNDGENDHYNLSLQLENSHGFPHGSIQLYEHQPSKPEDRNGVVSQVFFSHCQQKKTARTGINIKICSLGKTFLLWLKGGNLGLQMFICFSQTKTSQNPSFTSTELIPKQIALTGEGEVLLLR